MYLWQKYKYITKFLRTNEDFVEMVRVAEREKNNITVFAFDTESTGLHIIKDIPFLVGFGFSNYIYVYEPTKEYNEVLYNTIKRLDKRLIGHNTKFDYHMMRNFGSPSPKDIRFGDTMTIARLTSYVDSQESLSLENLSKKHLDSEASFGSKAIKEHLNRLNGERLKKIREYVKGLNIGISYTEFMTKYKARVQFVENELDEYFNYVNENFPEVNYRDVYIDKPTIMINYLYDDIVMTLELYKLMTPVLDVVDVGRKTYLREAELIPVVADYESIGFNIDIDYLLKSRLRVMDYEKELYERLWEVSGANFRVGQHAFIKDLFASNYKIGMYKTDVAALEEIKDSKDYPIEARETAKYIVELRTISKWLSTYIEGKLNSVYNGKLYTNINNTGAVTGRVSSDLQQQPSSPLLTLEGVELFHPRKPFINDEGYTNYYVDFSNMELRVQAYYTLLTSDGDMNMCRAFMPFECVSMLTGEKYDPEKDIDRAYSGEWIDENDEPWTPLDLHTATALKAFPEASPSDPDFKHYRDLGKRANFLKNYGGGKGAIMTQLGVDNDTAEALDNGYYSAFPKVLDYQKWVEESIRKYGYVENLYGRRYYFEDNRNSYRGYNYLIQGSCADFMKAKQIELSEFLKGFESKMLMPIHDEIVFKIKHGEEFIIDELARIMQDAKAVIKKVPMTVGIDKTLTNWAEAKGVDEWEN